MACSIIRNKATGELTNVLAPNGKDSILFKDILSLPGIEGQKEEALRVWAIAYTPEFKQRYGDWELDPMVTKTDENGEPVSGSVIPHMRMAEVNYNLESIPTFNTEAIRLEKMFKVRFNTTAMSMSKAQQMVRDINAVAVTGKADVYAFVDTNGMMMYQVVFNETDGSAMTSRDMNTSDPNYQESKRQVNEVLDHLTKKIKGIKVEWISAKDLKQSDHKNVNLRKINAFVKGDTVYLVEGRVNADIAMEEVLHFVTSMLEVDRPALLTGLFQKAKAQYPGLWNQIEQDYSNEEGFTASNRRLEMVTRVLQKAMREELANNPERSAQELKTLMGEFFKWIRGLFERVFKNSMGDALEIDLRELPLDMTFNDLAFMLNTKNVQLAVFSVNEILYNLEEENNQSDEEPTIPGDIDAKDAAKRAFASKKQLERVDGQIANIDVAIKKGKPTAGQRNTLIAIRQQLEDYRKILETSPGKTRSVSTVIGKNNAEGAENYANFGTFLHNMLEEAQIMSLEKGRSATVLYTRELFDTRYAEVMANEKTMFEFPGMTPDDVFNMTVEIIGFLQEAYSGKNIILPEMTVISTDSYKGTIVGRIDFMAIDEKGRVKIYDLKTSRMNSGDTARAKLSKKWKKESFVDGFTPEFGMIRSRSKFMDWDAQLSMYERMLKQYGIETTERVVLSMTYINKHKAKKTSGKEFEFGNYMVQRFGEGMYAYQTEFIRNDEGEVIGENVSLIPDFKRIRAAAAAAVPVKGEEENVEREKIREGTNYFGNFKDETVDEFVADVIKAIDEQIRLLQEELKRSDEYFSDPKVKEYYESRQKSLYEIQQEFAKASTDDEKLALAKSFKLSAAVATLSTSAGLIEEEAVRIESESAAALQEAAKIADPAARAKLVNELRQTRLTRLVRIKDEATHLKDVFEIMLQSAQRTNSDSKAQLNQVLTNAISALETSIAKYLKLGEELMIDVIEESVPKELMDQILVQRGEYLEGVIQGIEQEIEKLENPDWKPAVWQLHKRLMYNEQQVEQLRVNTLAEKKEELAEAVRRQQQKTFGRKDIEDYVHSLMSNSNSKFYLGSSTSTSAIGFGLGDIISGSFNPELIVFAIFNRLRNLTLDAQNTAMDKFYEIDFDTKVRNYVNRKGGEVNANKALSETRTVTYVNPDGTTYTKEHRTFINPVAQDYFDVIDTHRRVLRDKRALLKDLSKQKKADPTDKDIAAQHADLLAELNNDVATHEEWLNDHSQRRFVDEVYKLQMKLPQEVQDEISQIDDKISQLRANKGGVDELLSETELDKLQDLELERTKIVKEALKNDPAYQDTLEKYKKYFYYDENWGLFNRIRAEKLAEYGADSEEFKRWESLNMFKQPNEKFYEERSKIYDKMGDILGGRDPEMGELLLEQSKIKSKYKLNGQFLTSDMDARDIEIFDKLQDRIDEILGEQAMASEAGGGMKLSATEKKRLATLRKKLDDMQRKEENPDYLKEIRNRTDELMLVAANLRQTEFMYGFESDPATKAKLEEQYLAEEENYNRIEEAFEIWYNNNHTDKYSPGTFRRNEALNPNPKSFHYSYVANPERGDLVDVVLHRRFRIRRYTDEAMNPDYHETPEGYAMPKGLKLENNRYEITGTNKYINDNFIKLTQNQEDYDFYNWHVMDNFIANQNDTVGRRLGFLFPGVTMNKIDNIKEFGIMEGINREVKETMDSITLGKSAIDNTTNEYGTSENMRVRFKYNFPMEADLTTTNGISAVGMWMVEREINHEMGKAEVAMSAMVDALENMRGAVAHDKKRSDELAKVIELVTFERDKFIYGKRMKTTRTGKSQVATMKFMRQFMKVVSFGRLGFDLAMQTGNMVSGNIQAFLSTQEGMGTAQNFLWGKKKAYDILMNMVGDYGKVSDVSFETKMVRFMNPTQKDMAGIVELNTKTAAGRMLTKSLDIGNLAYMMQDKGETEIAVTTMAMVMDNYKFNVLDLDANGNVQFDSEGNKMVKKDADGNIEMVNGWDAFTEDASGKIVTRKDVDITEQQVKMMRNKVYAQILQAQGNYADYTATHMSSTLFGVLLQFYKKYFVPAAMRRFGSGQEDYEGGRFVQGWYRILYGMFKRYGLKEGMKVFLPGNKSNVNNYYKTGAYQAGRELLTGLVMMMLYQFLRSKVYSDDDDESELNWMEMQILRTFAKVTNESRSMIPVPKIGNVDTYIDSFSNFTTVFKEGKTMWKLLENGMSLMAYEMLGEEYAENALYQKTYGMYEEGDAKALKNFHDLIGYDNIIGVISPEYKLKEQYKNK